MRVVRTLFVAATLVAPVACGDNSSPSSPSATQAGGSTVTAPTPASPDDQSQLTTLRPTLIVRNGSSDQSGARTYEFQIADTNDFSTPAAATFVAYSTIARQAGIPEGASGTTSYTPDIDLQPTTRMYWRARILQGTSVSAWTPTRSFNTAIGGYIRPGALYDPLVNGSTVGVPVGSTTFIPGKGLRLDQGTSYVRYQLPQTVANGEFSMELEGIYPGGPGAKLKLFSMSDGTGDVFRSQYLLVAQYRGLVGNPDNSIAFKALFGDPTYKLEPDFGARAASIFFANPNTTYFWKATWNTEFRLQVYEGGIGGTQFYNVGILSTDTLGNPGGAYNPNPHFAYLGANNESYGEENGSWPGVTYRNVWLGSTPRPRSLGSALLPQ